MISGRVPRGWARRTRPRWLDELEGLEDGSVIEQDATPGQETQPAPIE
jgi:hypothetical protein